MIRRIATRVLVVGGGPVGTTLAMDLAWRGIDVVVAEQRHRGSNEGATTVQSWPSPLN
jgi:2-polyprenyl-6-methoxyphenol hydroxylase-like FAD-dependent oxidoreductase